MFTHTGFFSERENENASRQQKFLEQQNPIIVQVNKTLTTVNLENNGIGGAGAKCIADALKVQQGPNIKAARTCVIP